MRFALVGYTVLDKRRRPFVAHLVKDNRRAWHRLGGDAIDGRILDPVVRRLEEAGFEVYLVNARNQESTGSQERRARQPVATTKVQLRITILPPITASLVAEGS